MKSNKFQYNNQFLDKIVVSMLTDKSFLLRCMDLNISQYIDSQPHEWFTDFIIKFFKDYKVEPTMESLKIKIESIKQPLLKQLLSTTYISILNAFEQNNLQFIKNTVIQFCRFQQIKKAITKSIQLLQDQSQDFQNIYQLINKTRFKGMQADLGVEYVDSFQRRHSREVRKVTQTPWVVVNNALNGGTKESTLNIFLAPPGCVTEDTKILIKLDGQIKTIEVGYIESILKENKNVFVSTLRQQFTRVTNYVKKGILDTFLIKTQSGKEIKVSNDHLFFSRTLGWVRTRNLNQGQYILCQNQIYQKVVKKEFIGKFPIVDITVEHPEHCYYGNGILNHNTGKSWLLINIAAHCLKLNKKVVYYSLEMTQDQVGCRIDYKLLDKPQSYLANPQNFQKCVKLIQPYRNNLRIKQFMPNLTTVSQIENHFTQMKLFDDFQADVIIIDYADIIKKQTGGDNTYLSYGDVYTNLKRFAKTYKKVIWTGSQGNRGAMASDLVLGDSVAHSMGKLQIADFVLSMSRKHQDKLSNTARFVVVKNRSGRDGMVYNGLTNLDNGTIEMFDAYTKQSVQAKQKMDNNDLLLKQKVRQRLMAIKDKKEESI